MEQKWPSIIRTKDEEHKVFLFFFSFFLFGVCEELERKLLADSCLSLYTFILYTDVAVDKVGGLLRSKNYVFKLESCGGVGTVFVTAELELP